MTALRRLIKPKLLKSYLDLACEAFDGALAVAVRVGAHAVQGERGAP